MNATILIDTLIWGFVATIGLTITIASAQGFHYTRVNLPFILGTMFTGNLDRANRIGYVLHFVMGWMQAYVYLLIFWSAGAATWYGGALLGLVHALFLLTVILPFIPSIHPRMVAGHQQPRPTALLEPPGFLGLHYGAGTPVVTLVAHLLYGAVLGVGISVG